MPETRKSFTASKRLKLWNLQKLLEIEKPADILKYPSQISDFGGKGIKIKELEEEEKNTGWNLKKI